MRLPKLWILCGAVALVGIGLGGSAHAMSMTPPDVVQTVSLDDVESDDIFISGNGKLEFSNFE